MEHIKTVLNKYGFRQLAEIPSQAEINDYYANKYYQTDNNRYYHAYSSEELAYFNNKIAQKYLIINQLVRPAADTPTLLDVGCGEGFTLAWFKKKGWSVKGIDFSNFGCKHHNPDMLPFVETGDVYVKLGDIIEQKSKFDCIWLDNVLEHVVNPGYLMEQLQKIVHAGSVLVIEVPNDCSVLQEKLLAEEKINRAFWLVSPDHISYFNKTGLENLANAYGWNVQQTMADFPIDFNLANPSANYVNQKETGKGAHLQRVFIENLMHSISPELTNQYYDILAQLGLGRQIISFLTPQPN